MKKKLVVAVSIIAVVLTLLTSFTSASNAQTVNNKKVSIIQHIRDKIVNGDWFPGYWVYYILEAILLIIIIVLCDIFLPS